WERSRSIGVSNSQVTTGSTKCPGNFTSLDTPPVMMIQWLGIDKLWVALKHTIINIICEKY
ncbi:MAG: hypothetical protein MJE68_02440, partial [Proteobacteria bacterium]|nr:hypothetical protein [Pseudomonadota bacterium]